MDAERRARLEEPIGVLDHGYVRLVESWGSDERIVEAARMSTGKGFLGWGGTEWCLDCLAAGALADADGLYHTAAHQNSRRDCKTCKGTARVPGDEKLLRYLWEHGHATPFEMAGATFEVQAPIVVFRQWFTHRTQSRNEHSARYSELPELDYVPTLDRCMLDGGKNRQARGRAGTELTMAQADQWRMALRDLYAHAQQVYEQGLAAGIPNELARLPLTVGRYSKMRVSANLRNWLHFLGLRLDGHAQHEIRQFAGVVGQIVGELYPRTWALFAETRRKEAR